MTLSRVSVLLWLVGCVTGGVKIGDDSAPVGDADADTDTDGDTDADADGDTDADTDTDTTGAVGDCEIDPTLQVLSVESSTVPDLALARHLDVSLSGAAELGVACERGDASEVLFWSFPSAASHAVDLFGFAPGAEYTCRVAPVCPRMSGSAESVTFTVGAVPSSLVALDIERHATLSPSGPPYLILNSGPCSGSGGAYITMYDMAGTPRWYYQLPSGLWADVVTDYLGDGQVSWGGGFSSVGVPHIIDLLGNDVAQAGWPGASEHTFTHEGHVLPDGRFLSFAWVDNGSGRNTWTGFEIYISSADGTTLDWSWNSQVASDSGVFPNDRSADSHGNWAEYVVRDDGSERVYASACYLDTILAIDVPTGDVLWALGPGGDFTVVDTDGTPLGDDGYTDCQHGIEIDGDKVLAYDNGMSRSYSRAVEYDLDESTWTATRTWDWTEAGWDADLLGDIDYLPDDHVLITEGQQDCAWSGGDSVKSSVVEVERAGGEVVWRARFDTDDNLTFRSQKVDACDRLPNVAVCPEVAAAYAEVRGVFE